VILLSPATVFDSACTAIATGCAVYVALRDGRWRKTGLAKQLSDRIDLAQKTADLWHDSAPARELKAEIDRQGGILTVHTERIVTMATQVEVARVESAAKAAAISAEHAAAGVDRIEAILLKKALNT